MTKTTYFVQNKKDQIMGIFNTRAEAEKRMEEGKRWGWTMTSWEREVRPAEEWELEGCKQNEKEIVWHEEW